MNKKEQFINKHNSMAPANLKATIKMLHCFESQKPTLFKNNDYSIEKIRRPFVLWLTSLTAEEKAEMNDSQKKQQ